MLPELDGHGVGINLASGFNAGGIDVVGLLVLLRPIACVSDSDAVVDAVLGVTILGLGGAYVGS